ncbi:MAG TPA: tetratricopeptide repeat protein [Rhizomicrobium sp.]|jgi:predicted O-linked N-acetylglucosamine transferase (SPINDLY family)|nr:tetratricopeptide repeat protein [Rhizomicrobium sp.]
MTEPFEQAYNDALAHHRQGRLADADRLYAQAVALKPDLVEAHNNRGAIRQLAGDWAGALSCYDAAIRFRPGYAEALANRGNVLIQLRRYDAALASFERALALTPGRASALNGRAGVLFKLKRFEQALAAYEQLRAADPANPYALGGMLIAAMNLCDWKTVERIAPEVRQGIVDGTAVVAPFPFLGLSDDKALQLKCARNAIAELGLQPVPPLWRGERYAHDRIRLAYISSDFCQHPVPLLIARLIESHDREHFEVLGFSTGLNDNSPIRARIEKAFDRFHDVQGQTPAAIARRLREDEVDILVDLTGHTEGDHFEILNRRPCPIQVNWLGYPGTSGAASLDYILADPIVAPPEHAPFFREQIVQLPDCYFPTSYGAPAAPPSRAEAGLPPLPSDGVGNGFVFCSFNNSWKITRAMFDVWMRLLAGVPGSVLWLLESSTGFRDNLRREAGARAIAPERLVFAPRVSPDVNLARLARADLVLDTSPYNGHMTTSDALWAGVPLVTLAGQAFAGRVAMSQLSAIGMGELVIHSLVDYEALALKLACDPALLKATREKLARSRNLAPLFDTARMVQTVESAFATMLEIHNKGEAPRGFRVGDR